MYACLVRFETKSDNDAGRPFSGARPYLESIPRALAEADDVRAETTARGLAVRMRVRVRRRRLRALAATALGAVFLAWCCLFGLADTGLLPYFAGGLALTSVYSFLAPLRMAVLFDERGKIITCRMTGTQRRRFRFADALLVGEVENCAGRLLGAVLLRAPDADRLLFIPLSEDFPPDGPRPAHLSALTTDLRGMLFGARATAAPGNFRDN